MAKLVWLTDIHLNFVEPERRQEFMEEVASASAPFILLGGDIGESPNVTSYLDLLHDMWKANLFFVLGNHDFYYGSIAETRSRCAALHANRKRLIYLTSQTEPISLDSTTALIGHDGWADARAGDFRRSPIQLNDYRLIQELSGLTKSERAQVLRSLGDEAAEHIRRLLARAVEDHQTVFLLTHVPPWREACWYEGRISDDDWAPHFTCQAMGEAITRVMNETPHKRLVVLCGHTHGSGHTRPRENIDVYTGGAVYGHPAVSKVFDLNA